MIRTLRAVVAVLVLCLFAGSCFYQAFSFSAPTIVEAGSVFTVEVDAQFDALPVAGHAAAIFQVPDGFTIVGATAVARDATNGTPYLMPDPNTQLPMSFAQWPPAVEPNHYLRWFTGGSLDLLSVASTGSLKLYVRAPTAVGAYTIKLALGHRSADSKFGLPYLHALPQPGLGGFAGMTAPGHLRSIQVIAAAPPPPFALAALPHWLTSTPTPRHVALYDLDADGRDDLIEQYDAQVRVLLSRAGGWLPEPPLHVMTGSARVRCADFDGDTLGDLVLGSGAVYFGNGGSAWTPGPVLPHGLVAADVAVGDIDADGRADVVLANATGCVVFRGNSDRTFTPFANGLPPSTSPEPGRVAVVDLEGDRMAEILLWSAPGMPAQLWRSDGQGNWVWVGALSFGTAAPYALDDDPFAWIDLDGDGRLELLRSGSATALAYTGLAVTPITIQPFVFDRAVALDHDRDARMDLVTTMAMTGPSVATLWRNVGSGTFQQSTLPQAQGFRLLDRCTTLCAGDIEGDSFPDLAASFTGERSLVWRNTTTGAARYGAACAGTGFAAPQLSVLGTVAPGQSVTLQLTGALPNGPALVWAGLSKRTWAGLPLLPLGLDFVGAAGCELLAEPSVIVPKTADASGLITHVLPLPPLLPTDTLTFFLQGAVFAPGANAFQFLFSQGLALKMQ